MMILDSGLLFKPPCICFTQSSDIHCHAVSQSTKWKNITLLGTYATWNIISFFDLFFLVVARESQRRDICRV